MGQYKRVLSARWRQIKREVTRIELRKFRNWGGGDWVRRENYYACIKYTNSCSRYTYAWFIQWWRWDVHSRWSFSCTPLRDERSSIDRSGARNVMALPWLVRWTSNPFLYICFLLRTKALDKIDKTYQRTLRANKGSKAIHASTQ